jgi:predicted nucleotidyltransferase
LIPLEKIFIMEKHKIINLIKKKVKKISPDADIILYGSEARGESRPDSDIDILILIEENSLNVKSEISDTIYDIELETGVLISPIMYSKKDWSNRPFKTPFYINVMNEGKFL